MKRTAWMGLVAFLALAAGLWVARGSFAPRPAADPAPPPAAGDLPEPGDDVVARAMESAVVDSAEIKARWHDEVRSIDVSGLDPKQLALFVRHANSQQCDCGCGYTLAGCKASDMSCEVSGTRLDALLDSVKTGRIRRATGLRERPASGS